MDKKVLHIEPGSAHELIIKFLDDMGNNKIKEGSFKERLMEIFEDIEGKERLIMILIDKLSEEGKGELNLAEINMELNEDSTMH